MKSDQRSSDEMREMHGQEYVDHFEANRHLYEVRLNGILSHVEFNGEEKVADFGCGSGQLFEFIHHKIGAYHGIDFSQAFIDTFQNRLATSEAKIKPDLHCADIVEFCEKNPNEFDFGFTLDFSEHIYDDDFLKIYSAIFKSLKPGGKLIFHTPNGDFFLEWMRNHGLLRQHEQHVAVRNGRENAELLKQSGFSNVVVKYISHYNILKHLHFLSHWPLIGPAFRARLLIICTK